MERLVALGRPRRMPSRGRTALASLVAVAGLVAVASCGVFGQETLGKLVMFEAIEVVEYSGQAAELTSGQQPGDVLDGIGAGRSAERGRRGAVIAGLPTWTTAFVASPLSTPGAY